MQICDKMNVIVVMTLLWLSVDVFASSRPNYIWTRYTTEDGLSQNSVMSILQDQKGYMWFATWDGLSRFDGYDFKSYKIRPGDNIQQTSSRIDFISEDKYGFIWLLAYGRNVVRFDPVFEEFLNVPDEPDIHHNIVRLESLKKGIIWLITENEGAYRVETDSVTKQVTTRYFSSKNGLIDGNVVRKIYEDGDGNEWLLTNNGLFILAQNIERPAGYFSETGDLANNRQGFYSVCEIDSDIWFGSIRGRVWRYVKHGGRFILLQVPTTSEITSIHRLGNGEYFLATMNDGFFVYDSQTDSFTHFNRGGNSYFEGYGTYETYLDAHGDVWIQQNSGYLTQFRPDTRTVVHHRVSSSTMDGVGGPTFMIHEDVNGMLWVHPHGGGVYYLCRQTNVLWPFFDSDELLMTFSDRLHTMFSDRQGNLWMCTRAKGLEKFVFVDRSFDFLKPVEKPIMINDNDVRAVMMDSGNRLWVSTKSGKLVLFNKARQLIGYFGADGRIHKNIQVSHANVYCVFEDDDGIIWLGTKGDGLIRAQPFQQGGELRYHLTRFRYDEADLYSLSHNEVYHIYKDGSGRMWLATYGGGINLVETDEQGRIRFVNHRNHLNSYPINSCSRVRYITSDLQNNIWVGTNNGLVVFNSDFVEPERINFNYYTYNPGDLSCLSNNDVHSVLVTPDGDVYIATFGGGLNKVISLPADKTYRFKSYTKEHGLPADVVLSITEGANGHLWIATENGLSRFDTTAESFRNFSKTDFAQVLSFSEGPAFKDNDGRIWIGTNRGVLNFHPDAISESTFVPPVTFTEFRLLNKRMRPAQGSVLPKHIDAVEQIRLKHNQNILSFGFAALDMKYPEAVRYAVMLDGFDREWQYLEHYRSVNYTNLPAGDYTLRVRSTNSDGVWVNNERQLVISILPSFWVTPMAYLLYFIFFFAIGGLAVYILFTIYRLRHRIVVDQQVTDMKLDFFTNISHELRTPLTLITAPLEQVLNDKSLPHGARESLAMVEKNSKRMLRLINQILDFVKISNRKMTMRVGKIAVGQFVSDVMAHFRLTAQEGNILFTLNDKSDGACIWADADKLEKVIFNLLSNAFKYIDNGRFVKLAVDATPEMVTIRVSDNGSGIPEDKRSLLFERFGNSPARSRQGIPSSGIGLSLVKEFMDMHNGQVYLEQSGVDGTTFVLQFHRGLSHFGEDVEVLDVSDEVTSPEKPTEIALPHSDTVFDDEAGIAGQPVLLLVEDNAEVRRFVKSVLKSDYTVIEAVNGAEGFEKARSVLPDLIICDLMMPIKDGMEMLHEVRACFDTSHIPFIILTASANEQSLLSGLQMGADDYLTKPFSPAHLKLRIENLLEQRRKLQEFYQQKGGDNKFEVAPSVPEVTSHDEKFMADLKVLMEKNMDNSALVVDDLVSELAMSRSVFFKKLKALTGLAPIEFIREMRLKRAAQLIEIGEHNMTQIAFMVGMNDSRYFSKCFKQMYGVAPSVYKSRFH